MMGLIVRLAVSFWPEWLILAAILLVYAINLGHFSIFQAPDEIIYLQAAKEMLFTDHVGLPQFNHADYLERPPLFIWCCLLFFRVLGVSLLSAQLLGPLFAACSLVGTYLLAKALFSDRLVSILSPVMLATSWGFFKMVHVSVPDLAFVSLMTFSLLAFWAWFVRTKRPMAYKLEILWLSVFLGLVSGLSLLMQGPSSLLLLGGVSCLFLLLVRSFRRLSLFHWQGYWLGLLCVALPWLIWVTYQDGHRGFLVEYFVHAPLTVFQIGETDNAWYQNAFFLLLKIGAIFLPWTMFIVGPFMSYFGRHGQRKIIDFREAPITFLLVWAGWSIVLFPVCPPMVLPPLCLMTAYYVAKGLLEPRIPRSFVISTETTVLVMMTLAVVLTLSLFQLLPDGYSQQVWQLPGVSEWPALDPPVAACDSTAFTADANSDAMGALSQETGSDNAGATEALEASGDRQFFPVWKLWLLPFPILLIVTGLTLFFFLSVKQYQRVVEVLAASGLLFCLFIHAVVTPIFSPSAGERLAMVAQLRFKNGHAVFVYQSPGARPQLNRFVFTLDYQTDEPLQLVSTADELGAWLSEVDHHRSVVGVIDETDYYSLTPEMRRQLRIVCVEKKWFTNPFQLLIPSFLSPRNASGKIWDHLLLVERMRTP